MKKKIFIICITILSVSCILAKSTGNKKNETDIYAEQVKVFASDIEIMSKKLEVIEYTLNAEKDIISQSTDAINNELVTESNTLTLVGIILTILGFGIGVYVTWVSRRVEKILATVEGKETRVKEMLDQVEEKEKDVKELNEKIQNDISGLYAKLRREETVTLLNRLVEVPEDITNISSLLLSRQLEPEDFDLLNKAYIKLQKMTEIDTTNTEFFIILLFQHFSGRALYNIDLSEQLQHKLKTCISCAFKNDIEKATHDIVIETNQCKDRNKSLLIIEKYIDALCYSKFGECKDVFNIIIQNINDKEILKNVWSTLSQDPKSIHVTLSEMLAEYFKETDKEFVDKINKALSDRQEYINESNK